MTAWNFKTDESSGDMLEQIHYNNDTLDADSDYEMLGVSEHRTFSSGAHRDNADGKGRMDLLPWNAIRELSKHCERGAKHYGENNARKGIPMSSLMDSATRHLAQYISGDNAEPYHLVAAAWNVMFALEQQTTHPEMNDLPWQVKAVEENNTQDNTEEN